MSTSGEEFVGDQPVDDEDPLLVEINPTEPPTPRMPDGQVVPPTYDEPAQGFVGNQPVDNEPPETVTINAIEAGTANWPNPPEEATYQTDPPGIGETTAVSEVSGAMVATYSTVAFRRRTMATGVRTMDDA